MGGIVCLILARAHSLRLAGKHFLKLAGLPCIEHMARRCEHFGFTPIVCVPVGEKNDFAPYTSAEIQEGDPENVEARLIEVATRLDCHIFHALDGDDPFFDPFAVLESHGLALAHRFSQVRPSYHSQSGSGRMGTTYNLDAPAGGVRNLLDVDGMVWPQRLTLDYPEDYALIRMIAETVGGYLAPRRVVDDLFVRNPDLHRINWFRNAEWKARQRDELRSGS